MLTRVLLVHSRTYSLTCLFTHVLTGSRTYWQRTPEKAHLLPDGSIPPRVKWQYHYLQTFFGGGTHYIVCENANDSPDLSGFGPFGYISANGQALMFPRLKSRIMAGESASQSSAVTRHDTLPSSPLKSRIMAGPSARRRAAQRRCTCMHASYLHVLLHASYLHVLSWCSQASRSSCCTTRGA